MQLIIFIIYLYILFSVFLLYVLICGGTSFHSGGIIGKLNHKLIGICMPSPHSPSISKNGEDEDDQPSAWWCCFRPMVRKVEGYLCFSKNPLMQLVYVGLMFVNVTYFFWKVFFNFRQVKTIGFIHQVIAPFVLILAIVSFLVASYSNPGYITKENFKMFASSYQTNVYYPPNRICSTCKIPKPARSKHCGLSGHCVAKFDHFCPWINNAIGEWNYRYFHFFLIANCIMSYYGTYLIVMYLYGIISRDNLFSAQFMTTFGEHVSSNPGIVFQYMMSKYMWLIAQVIFGFCIGTMLFLFWLYHFVKMVLFNTTTNESFKMSEVEDWMEALKTDPKCFDDEWNELPEYQKYQVLQLKKMISKKEELTNPYYISLYENIMQVLSPPSLRKKISKFGLKQM